MSRACAALASDRSVYASSLSGNRPFVLLVAAWHKNVQILFDIARNSIPQASIFWWRSTQSAFSPVEQSQRQCSHARFVTDDDLAALYRNALCLPFPR